MLRSPPATQLWRIMDHTEGGVSMRLKIKMDMFIPDSHSIQCRQKYEGSVTYKCESVESISCALRLIVIEQFQWIYKLFRRNCSKVSLKSSGFSISVCWILAPALPLEPLSLLCVEEPAAFNLRDLYAQEPKRFKRKCKGEDPTQCTSTHTSGS